MARQQLNSAVKSPVRVAEGYPLDARGTRDGVPFAAPYALALAMEGRVFNGPHTTAASTAITGQTSFVATTPTFMLEVPSGTTAIPMMFKAAESGTAGGGLVTCLIVADTTDLYASGGTAETFQPTAIGGQYSGNSLLWSNPTRSAGFGSRVWEETFFPTTTAVGGVNVNWLPEFGHQPILVGPCSLSIYTYAASTGPTWLWTLRWIELPTSTTLG